MTYIDRNCLATVASVEDLKRHVKDLSMKYDKVISNVNYLTSRCNALEIQVKDLENPIDE